jgi:hypothetical protein
MQTVTLLRPLPTPWRDKRSVRPLDPRSVGSGQLVEGEKISGMGLVGKTL